MGELTIVVLEAGLPVVAEAGQSMRPIEEVAEQLGLARSDLVLHGPHIAKINWEAIRSKKNSDSGFLVLVTSISPTAFGEGKTVTTIGLNQGLNARGHNACCVIREPSMGPVFGLKEISKIFLVFFDVEPFMFPCPSSEDHHHVVEGDPTFEISDFQKGWYVGEMDLGNPSSSSRSLTKVMRS